MSKWLNQRRAQQQGHNKQVRLIPTTPPASPAGLVGGSSFSHLKPPEPPKQAHTPQALPPAPPLPPAQLPDSASEWLEHARQNAPIGSVDHVASEIRRILELPFLTPGVARCPYRAEYNKSLINPSNTTGFSFRDLQLDAIWTYEKYGGLLAPLGVGTGKTMISIMCGVKAIRARGHRRVVLLVPPEVVDQLIDPDLPRAREWADLQGVPFHFVVGDVKKRQEVVNRQGPGVWVFTYSTLSSPTGFQELSQIQATCYIMDEAHKVARADAARTKRFRTVWNMAIDEFLGAVSTFTGKPAPNNVEAVVLSGTIAKKSVADYAHLSAMALKEISPAPIREVAVTALASATDSDKFLHTVNEMDKNSLKALIHWCMHHGIDIHRSPQRNFESDEAYQRRMQVQLTDQEYLRNAYRERMRSSPGVIASDDQGVDASLIIRARPVKTSHTNTDQKERYRELVSLMHQVVVKQKTPSGDPIEYAMHNHKYLWELTAGFYNDLIWPTIEEVAEQYPKKHGKVISEMEAEALLEQAKRHHEDKQNYHKTLRQFLDRAHVPHCDSPMLVAAEIARQIDGHPVKHPLTPSLIGAYIKQRDSGPAVYPDLPERYAFFRRVCDIRVMEVVRWAEENKKHGGLMWYHHPRLGDWVAEELSKAGIPFTHARAGENKKAYEKGLVLASYAHGTGKNLQHHNRNLFIELRREANINEQTLGRTHRSGQQHDEVYCDVIVMNAFDLTMLSGIIRDSDYVQSTTGNRMRVCYASYSPPIPMTNPRLAERLGIVPNQSESYQLHASSAWDETAVHKLFDLITTIPHQEDLECLS